MPSRESYLRFLENMGKKEQDVLPILTDRERVKIDLLAELIHGAWATGDPEYQKAACSGESAQILWQKDLADKGTNTNFLLQHLNEQLLRELTELRISPPAKVFAGVYPTESFNAQAKPEDDGYLILLDTGCFETIEATVTVLLGAWTQGRKGQMLSTIVRGFCDSKKRVSAEELRSLPSDKENGLEIAEQLTLAEEITPSLTNACDRFVIAHEYGHLIQGHLFHGPNTRIGTNRELEVIAKDGQKEFEADLWAIHTLIKAIDARTRFLTYMGALIPLGLCLLVETWLSTQPKGKSVKDSHPPALERIRLLQAYYERLDWNLDYKGCGRLDGAFLELVSDCSKQLGGNGLDLCKSNSLESLAVDSDYARQLGQLMGAAPSSHARLPTTPEDISLLSWLASKMKLKLPEPTRSPLAQAINYAEKVRRRALYILACLVLTLLIILAICLRRWYF